jgi:hypothetical protein
MVQVDIKHALMEVSDIRFVADLGNYLGFPLVKGRVSKDVYNDILDRVQKKLASWKGNLLNKAGRACLGMGGQRDFFSLTEATTWVK